MMKDIFKHKVDYSILAAIAGIFVLYFMQVSSRPRELILATIAFGLAYFFWGIWHHRRVGNLSRHIMLEYFLVATLGIVIVSSLLL